MLNTEISLDNTFNPPPVVVVFPQPTASGESQTNTVNLPEHAFRLCFTAHQSPHILPYLDCTGRGKPADKILVSLDAHGNRYTRGNTPVAPATAVNHDTLVPTPDVAAGLDWDLSLLTGSAPEQWPVGYKEPPAPPLRVSRVQGGTRRYVCRMAPRYGKRRPSAPCADCGRQQHKIFEETQQSKQVCNQFAQQYRVAWQNHVQLSNLNSRLTPHRAPMDRTVAKAQTAKAHRKRADVQAVADAVEGAVGDLGEVRTGLIGLRPNLPALITADPAVLPQRTNAEANVIDDPDYVVAVRDYLNGLFAITSAVPVPRRFMIGVLICTLDDGSTRTYASISNGRNDEADVNLVKDTLAIQAAAQIGATYAPHPGITQPRDWAARNNLKIQKQGNSNTPGNCAAPKLIQQLYADNVHTQVAQFEMTEQWFDAAGQDAWDGLTEPSCETCQVQVPRMLCDSQ